MTPTALLAVIASNRMNPSSGNVIRVINANAHLRRIDKISSGESASTADELVATVVGRGKGR
jgi:hypothetical protein